MLKVFQAEDELAEAERQQQESKYRLANRARGQ